jgi:hypothetical protein
LITGGNKALVLRKSRQEVIGMVYELTTLELRLWGAKRAIEGISNYTNSPQSKGKLLGCWEVEVGLIGRMIILREFDNVDDLLEERKKLFLSEDPFNAGEVLNGFTVESFAPFPFMPPVQLGKLGPIYEFREYQLTVEGIKRSMDAWEKSLPVRQKISPVVVAMYALDGPTRMIHIIPYESFESRLKVRKELYQNGIWPPKGAPEQIVRATTMIALPTSISKLT